jgi:translation initiation factor IF-3
VLDYSKYKYEQAQKLKAARKHQQQITIREIKFRPKIATKDYETKKNHVTRFLLGRDKVKITIMFRGREVTHPERGTALLDRLAGELAEIAVVEQSPLQDGRNMTMMLAPSKAVLAADRAAHEDEAAPAKRAHRDGVEEDALAEEAGAAEVEAAAEPTDAEPAAEPEPAAAVVEPAPAGGTADDGAD